jgi:peptidyl-prolyl cis-trans isomerase D
MLQIFRDKSQSTFIQSIVVVISLVFVFWGVGANMMDSNEAAIVVNDEEISFPEYQRLYDKVLSGYRQQFGGAIPDELLKNLGISNQVKNQLIQQTLLRQGSSDMGILVSSPEIQKYIQGLVQFQENDAFNLDKYQSLLSANRLTPHKFEASQKVELLANKGIQAIGGFASTVTDAEIVDMYQQAKEAVSLEFVKISPISFIPKVTIEEEALVTWFAQNNSRYKTAPQVQLRFLSFPYKTSSDKAATFKAANDAYEGIISAGSLQEYATLTPDSNILETEFFSQGSPPDILDKAPVVQNSAFSLKAGELSSLIESPSGYSILFAKAIQEPQIPQLSAVKEQVTEDYRVEQSRLLAQSKAQEMLESLQSGSSFTELSQTEGMKAETVTLSRTSEPSETMSFPPSLLADIFTLSSASPFPAEPAKVGADFYLYKFNKRTLPDPSALSPEDKESYRAQILAAKQERILIAWIRHQERAADIFTNKTLK